MFGSFSFLSNSKKVNKRISRSLSGVLRVLCFTGVSALLTTSAQAAEAIAQIDTDKVLITIILKHQQDKNLTELQAKMDENRFWQSFPPNDMEIASWYVAMGLGQVITLKVHPKDIRRLNLAVEKSAWGIFNTEFYPSYEFKGIAASIKAEKVAAEK